MLSGRAALAAAVKEAGSSKRRCLRGRSPGKRPPGREGYATLAQGSAPAPSPRASEPWPAAALGSAMVEGRRCHQPERMRRFDGLAGAPARCSEGTGELPRRALHSALWATRLGRAGNAEHGPFTCLRGRAALPGDLPARSKDPRQPFSLQQPRARNHFNSCFIPRAETWAKLPQESLVASPSTQEGWLRAAPRGRLAVPGRRETEPHA